MAENGSRPLLLSVTGFNPRRWHELLSKDREVVLEPDGPDDPSITYAVVWKQRPNLLSSLPNLRAIFSIGAGVDHIFADPGLPDVPIVRVVAENLTQYMTEYVLWRVLDHHRQGMLLPRPAEAEDLARAGAAAGRRHFRRHHGPRQLGRAAARTLLALGFRVNGWSRSEKTMTGVATFHGDDGLVPFLNATDILVVLLPLTPADDGHRQLRAAAGAAQAQRARRRRADQCRARPVAEGRRHPARAGGRHAEGSEPRRLRSRAAAADQPALEPSRKSSSRRMRRRRPTRCISSSRCSRRWTAFERGEPLQNVVDRDAGY